MKKKQKKRTRFSKILENYYWTHRNFRTSRLHRYCGIDYREYESICDSIREPTRTEVIALVYALRKARDIFNHNITKCIQELLTEYVERSEYGNS